MSRSLRATGGPRHGWSAPGTRAAIAAVVLVLLVGLPAAWARDPGWKAHASLLVLPTGSTDPNELASLYDTLSRGQVPATYAELIRDSRPVDAAAAGLNLSAEQRRSLIVDVEVVPDTSVIDISVTAPRRSLATAVADRVAAEGNRRIGALGGPYESRPLSGAAGTAARQPLGRLTAIAMVGVLALVAGVVAQQVTRRLRPGRHTAGVRTADATGVGPDGAADGSGDGLFPVWDDGQARPSAHRTATDGARAPAAGSAPSGSS